MSIIRLFVMFIGAVVVANYVWGSVTGTRSPPELKPQFPHVSSFADPWADREKYNVKLRDNARKSASEGLAQSWGGMCNGDGRKRLVDALNYYYYHRSNLTRIYSAEWGDAGARFIKQAWATPDDNRVERLTREIYGRGYFTPDDLDRGARPLAAEIVRDVKVTAKPCKA